MTRQKGELATGVIRGSHGVRGELKVQSFSGETGHFSQLERVTLRKGTTTVEYRVEGVRRQRGKVLLKLADIDSPEAARHFTGYEIWVPREQAAPCGEDEYYIADLLGLKLVYEGRPVATVASVWDSGAASMLEVVTAEDKTVVVPFQDPYIGEVRLSSGEIDLRTLWILE